jgi:circadian clock protein KaiB
LADRELSGAMAEQGSPDSPPTVDFLLSLFVSGTTARSLRAIATIRELCEKTIPGNYRLDVVDVYDDPAAARAEQIVAVPTLVMKLPLPRRLFVGDMSDTTRLLAGLGAIAANRPGDEP